MQRFPSCVLGSKQCALQRELRCSRHQASQLTPLSPLQPCSSPSFFKIYLFILIGGQSLHNTVMAPATDRHESATGAHVPHSDPDPPSHRPPPSILLGGPRAPALSAPLPPSALVIYFTYGNVDVSMLFSHPYFLPIVQ